MKEYKSLLPEITLKYKKGETKKFKITTSRDSNDILKVLFNIDTVEICEEFLCIFLNRNNNTIGWWRVSQGGMTGTVVDVRLILVTALQCGATSIIAAHNHPSGNTKPSDYDKRGM
jgi:DNA repair protein RadC